jgi:hypothetical protein
VKVVKVVSIGKIRVFFTTLDTLEGGEGGGWTTVDDRKFSSFTAADSGSPICCTWARYLLDKPEMAKSTQKLSDSASCQLFVSCYVITSPSGARNSVIV